MLVDISLIGSWPLFTLGLLGVLVWRWWSRESGNTSFAELYPRVFIDFLLGSMVGGILVISGIFIIGSIHINLPAKPDTNIWTVFAILVAILTFMMAYAFNLVHGLEKRTKVERKKTRKEMKAERKRIRKDIDRIERGSEELSRLHTFANLSIVRNSIFAKLVHDSDDANTLGEAPRVEALAQIMGLFQVEKPESVVEKISAIANNEKIYKELSPDAWEYIKMLGDYYKSFPEKDLEGNNGVRDATETLLTKK